jgi:hypothetical protein
MRHQDSVRSLSKLTVEARRELFGLLSASNEARADAIWRIHARPESRALADVLIDLQASPLERLEVLRLLRDSFKPEGS